MAQALARKAHPMLGMVYSIFSSIFSWGGDSDQSAYLKALLKSVDKMIKGQLRDFSAKLKKERVLSLMDQMSVWGTRTDQWVNFPTQVAGAMASIFGESCWTAWWQPTCLKERTSGSRGGAGLLLELQFMDLITTSFCTFRGYGHKNFGLTELILKASTLTSQHMAAFKTYRLAFSSSSHGVTEGGNVACNGNSLNNGCWTDSSDDLLLGTKICGQPRQDYGGSWKQQKAMLRARRDTCISDYKKEIIKELETLEAMSAAQLKAAGHISHTGGETTSVKARSAICRNRGGVGGRPQKYSINVGANKLGACAEWV